MVGAVLIFALGGDSKSSSRTSAGSSSSSETSEEQEVREFLETVMADKGDFKDALPYFCQADQDLFEKVGGLDAIDIPHDNTSADETAQIDKITVNGDKATVDLSTSRGAAKFYLRKEDGSWKICMTDSPGMPSMP
ncbi:Lumazine-binding domain [Mycobacterium senegalense]|uniref:Lumazine-binding domain n=1 Tax=Mycolicibacterium senegalense TaxID=1796 RepID=A0A378T547_9MYCO|nr:Lumazine-binding domain [Mycolicibacterium senegalense]